MSSFTNPLQALTRFASYLSGGQAKKNAKRTMAERLNRSYKPISGVKILDLSEQDEIDTPEEMFLWQYAQGWLATPELRWMAADRLKVDLKKIDLENGKYLG